MTSQGNDATWKAELYWQRLHCLLHLTWMDDDFIKYSDAAILECRFGDLAHRQQEGWIMSRGQD